MPQTTTQPTTPSSPPAHTNRLINETSPYLLQHAHNPVDWHPWGQQAFEEARKRDAPIFLSIGYSTCYWCHVMERESFENETIAKQLNDNFVCIKVDREQRPDIDDIYMAATVLMTGRGGWPMTCFLEPKHLMPFWCGTYFPAISSPATGNAPSLPQVLDAMRGAWNNQRDDVLNQAQQVANAVKEQLAQQQTPVPVGPQHVQRAIATLLQGADRVMGGFWSAPKFPQPTFLNLLLAARPGVDDNTRAAIDQTDRKSVV